MNAADEIEVTPTPLSLDCASAVISEALMAEMAGALDFLALDPSIPTIAILRALQSHASASGLLSLSLGTKRLS